MRAVRTRTEYLYDPVGISEKTPQLMWNCEGGIRQTACRVQARRASGRREGRRAEDTWEEKELLWDTGRVETSAMRIRYAGKPLGSRSRVEWRVCLWDEKDEAGEWSSPAYFELGLLEIHDWAARWIDPELPNADRRKKTLPIPEGLGRRESRRFVREWAGRRPASCLRKHFVLDAWKRPSEGGRETEIARLYVTSHGIYDVWINGSHVDGYFLAPGFCQIPERLQVQTYDVAELLVPGENEIFVTLGDGWYRSVQNPMLHMDPFGEDLALLLQLEVAGRPVAVTGQDWTASQDGPLGMNDIVMGEYVDARREPVSGWHPVTVQSFGYRNLTGTDTCPVTGHEILMPEIITTPAGETVLDFGQVIAGFVQMDINASEGETLILSHGETLDGNGNFVAGTTQDPPDPRTCQQVWYICKNGRNSYHPTKCWFSFRYVKLEGDWVFRNLTRKNGRSIFRQGAFTAIAVYSDMEETGQFTCGNSDINRLLENARWSMKGNFVDIPARDRCGCTGDLQVFAGTAMYLMDSWPVLRRWLRELAATQFMDGCVRQIAPFNGKRSDFDGSAGWSDAFVTLPWQMTERYDDPSAAGELYEQMRAYVLFCLNRAEKTRLRHAVLRRDLKPYLNDQGAHWGDGKGPGTGRIAAAIRKRSDVSAGEATAWLSAVCRSMAQLAERLGKMEDARRFQAAGEKAAEAYSAGFLRRGRVPRSRQQSDYVLPLSMGLLKPGQSYLTAEALAENIHRNHNHLNTGFLTTHELLYVLTDNGQASTAYDLLLQTEEPGWISEIRRGATTIWERWDGIDRKGNVNGSLNHYAGGSVAGWLFGRVLGIVVEDGRITIRPWPDSRLRYAEGSYLSPFGLIGSGWTYTGDGIEVHVRIPANCTATVVLPDGRQVQAGPGEHRYTLAG